MLSKYKCVSYFVYLLLLPCITAQLSCKKLIDIDAPKDAVSGEAVFTTDATATAVMNGIYVHMVNDQIEKGYLPGITLFGGLSADEISLYPGVTNTKILGYYKNELSYQNISDWNMWRTIYNTVFTANSVIEGATASNSLTPQVKKQLLGEAYFMRAFSYFYLTNLYGNVPLVLHTNYSENSMLTRSTDEKVWGQIESDFKTAQEMLSDKYIDGTLLQASTERVRPTKWAATAMLARTFLYRKKYQEAETEATKIIDNPTFVLEPLDNVFLKSTKEAIWNLQPVGTAYSANTQEGRTFVLPADGPDPNFSMYILSDDFCSLFDDADQRKHNWINSVEVMENGVPATYYYGYKYKVGNVNSPSTTEYSMVLRLAEQYLIRAEARAEQENIDGGLDDLNMIRGRAGLADTSVAGKIELLDAVMHERRLEFFMEWGHRWLDLKRTNRVDDVMTAACVAKGGTWQPYKAYFPLSLDEIKTSPLISQTPGY